MQTSLYDPLSVSTAQIVTAPAPKPKFVEGTVYQLARTLYEIHTAYESLPASAIQDTMQRMSDNPDRKVLLIAARSQADVLARKRLIIVSTGKPQPRISLTVFEQAQLMKQTKIKRLVTENQIFVTKPKKSKKEVAIPSTPAQTLFPTGAASTVEIKIKKLQRELEEAVYSEKETVKAAARLQRIQKMDQQTDESEDTTLQMSIIWKTLVQALLLLKLAPKTQGSTPIVFDSVTKASKEPIATLWRYECGKLGRLVMGDAETVRSFSVRCRAEERYCVWLSTLHVLDSKDPKFDSQAGTYRQMACDVDEQLCVVLSSVVPTSYAYMRANVEKDAPIGGKFAALCLAIEGEADFQKEHPSQTNTVSFLETSKEHMVNVALASRIAKDPMGVPLKENQTESYSKTVSTEYGMKKKKKPREEKEEGEKEEQDTVLTLQPDPTPYFEHLWNRVLALEADNSQHESAPLVIAPKQATTRVKLACFDFRRKGTCERGEKCDFAHDATNHQAPAEKFTKNRATSRSPPPRHSEGLGRAKSRSPRRENHSPPRRDTHARHAHSTPSRSYPPREEYYSRDRRPRREYEGKGGGKGGKGGKGHGRGSSSYEQQRVKPHSPPSDNTCRAMWHISCCHDKQCRRDHGVSAGDSSINECSKVQKNTWCSFLWSPNGCNRHHGRTKNG
jgi:hypothetical protein